MTVFIICYALVLIAYFFTETSGNMKLRAPNKIILASMFLIFGFVQFFTQYEQVSFHLVLITALVFAWLGDVLLLFDFNRGGDFFLASNICFIVYQISCLINAGLKFTDYYWAIIIALVLVVVYAVLSVKWKKLDTGKMKWPMVMYMLSITLNGLSGVALMVLIPNTPLALLGLGTLLFMVSDYILTVYKFIIKGNKWLLRANSCSYFVGMLLIVLSMAM